MILHSYSEHWFLSLEEVVQVKIIPGENEIPIEVCECEQCVIGEDVTNESYNCQIREEQKWTDKDVHALIDIWATKEILFNMKHQLYYNKDERMKAIDNIRVELNEKGLMYTSKQISDKITNLRTYYGGQKRIIEASKKSDSGEIYVSKWKFFPDMSFISDNIIHRGTHDAPTSKDLKDEERSITPPSNGYTRTYNKQQKPNKISNADYNAYSNRLLLVPPSNGDGTPNKTSSSKNQDEIFGELITQMICDIPECHEKAMLKIELQHKIVTTQYKIAAQNKMFT